MFLNSLPLSVLSRIRDKTDRGFQYTSKVFQAKLRENEMKHSMSRVDHCIDNGSTEDLWGIIKSEMYCMYEITDENSLKKTSNLT